MGVMLTASKVKMMFTAIDVAADAEWLRQREAKQAVHFAYKIGWYLRACGGDRPLVGDVKQAGWDAQKTTATGELGEMAAAFGEFVADAIVALADVEVREA
jgi:hypothetical protein